MCGLKKSKKQKELLKFIFHSVENRRVVWKHQEYYYQQQQQQQNTLLKAGKWADLKGGDTKLLRYSKDSMLRTNWEKFVKVDVEIMEKSTAEGVVSALTMCCSLN